jgi:SHS2 domain-containing protein
MYEVFAHTADLGLRITAPDLDALFSESGQAFFSTIVADLSEVQTRSRVEFHIEGRELTYLFFDWLNELLFTFESQRLLLAKFDASIDAEGLHGHAEGETLDDSRHELIHEVKAVTYHGLRVEQISGQWIAEVILDI